MAPGKLVEASEKAAQFFENNISEQGELTAPGSQPDLCFYYKLPTLLLVSGRYNLAHRVLDYIKKTFLQENGDFRTSAEVKTSNGALCEFYAYMNGWVLMAAQRLGRFDVVAPGYEYLKKFFSEDKLGGFTTNGPVEGGNGITDMLSVSHFGMLSLYLGDLERAKSAGQVLQTMMAAQPDSSDAIYLRMNADGKLLTEFPAEASVFHIVKRREANQLYFMIGYPIAYLANLHQATNDNSYLATAKEFIEFCLGCHESMYTFHFAHKVAYGTSIVASITKEPKYKALVEKISAFLVSLQDVNGVFLADASPADKYDQSAEIGVWLRDIDANLSSLTA